MEIRIWVLRRLDSKQDSKNSAITSIFLSNDMVSYNGIEVFGFSLLSNAILLKPFSICILTREKLRRRAVTLHWSSLVVAI